MLEASEFKVIGEQREGVGVEADATIRIAGFKSRDRIRVSGWEPPRLLRIEHLGWVKGTGVLILSPTKEGTHLHWTESLIPPLGIAGQLGLWLLRPHMRRVFERGSESPCEFGSSRLLDQGHSGPMEEQVALGFGHLSDLT